MAAESTKELQEVFAFLRQAPAEVMARITGHGLLRKAGREARLYGEGDTCPTSSFSWRARSGYSRPVLRAGKQP
ncbi:MAG: hypothetical protein ACYC9M_16220 [Desulfobulbaceae bacterium]